MSMNVAIGLVSCTSRAIRFVGVVWLGLAITGCVTYPARDAETTMPATVPQRIVVLTFDDAVRSHLTNVAPLLRQHGFGATFFVTQAWMDDASNYLDWEDIAALDRMGFEVGNHSWSHPAFATPKQAERLRDELQRVEEALAHVGVAHPVSFSWTGNHFGPEARQVLLAAGYQFARRGPQPDAPPSAVVGLGQLYDPRQHDPLLIPSSGLAVPGWQLDDFRAIVDRAGAGRVAVLQFHGVPDERHPPCSLPYARFEEFVSYLDDNDFTVIALRDLPRYVDVPRSVDDPLLNTRFIR